MTHKSFHDALSCVNGNTTTAFQEHTPPSPMIQQRVKEAVARKQMRDKNRTNLQWDVRKYCKAECDSLDGPCHILRELEREHKGLDKKFKFWA